MPEGNAPQTEPGTDPAPETASASAVSEVPHTGDSSSHGQDGSAEIADVSSPSAYTVPTLDTDPDHSTRVPATADHAAKLELEQHAPAELAAPDEQDAPAAPDEVPAPAPAEPDVTAEHGVPEAPAEPQTPNVAVVEPEPAVTAPAPPVPEPSQEPIAETASAPSIDSPPDTEVATDPDAKPESAGRSRPGVRSGTPRAGRPGSASVMPPRRGQGSGPRPVPTIAEPLVETSDPHKWGRIDDEGVVYVYSSSGERAVGNWQAGDVDAGLAHFGRRYDDFITEIGLLEKRLATGSGDAKATKAHAIELRESVDSLPAVGDLDTAAARLEIVIGAADLALAGASQARVAAKARAIAAKEALCAEAEELAESTQWKTTGDRLKEVVEEWRTIHGIDRKTDDALWRRFAKARDTFTRHRGTHFADLDKQRSAAKDAKETLISRAVELSTSTDWGKTAGEYRTLMEQWKASGRAPREVEDQLWERFRAAQETFFSHRNQTFSERDGEFEANAETKEKLLADAEKLDPIKDLPAARSAMRSISERWEAAGKVPRERIREFDSRMRAVEDKIKRAEDSHWRRTDPETAARIEQFRARAQTYRAQAAKSRASGDRRRADEADAQAVQWEEWLAAAEGAVEG